MSIKDLFKKNQEATQILKSDSIANISEDAESKDFVREKIESKERFIPQFDFNDPKNFARFGLAEEYYEQSIKRVYNTYPYDGSRYEIEEWHNSSAFFDEYIFDNEYPRRTGYVIFGDDWGDKEELQNGYGAPATASYEYILIKGGPNKDPDNTALKDIFPSNDGKANLFKTDQNRECNLKIEGMDGNTVEFWMKKEAFDTSGKTQKEVILDVYSTSSISSSSDYGRFRVEMYGDTSSDAAASLVNAIDVTGVGNDHAFTLTSPTAMGGDAVAYTFKFVHGLNEVNGGAAGNVYYISRHSDAGGTITLTTAQRATALANAINGLPSPYAAFSDGNVGSINSVDLKITADASDGDGTIDLTFDLVGGIGNEHANVLAATNGFTGSKILETAFTGGADKIGPFLMTYMSGTDGIATASVGTGVTPSTIADNKWHHYAVSVRNDDQKLRMRLYVDGEFNHQVHTGSSIGYVSSSLIGTIGALAYKPSSSIDPEGGTTENDDDTLQPTRGWGKLSASLDEFRYWKQERNAQQIGRKWFTNIYGGSNTDLSNTQLGVYYKFNEGITGTSSLDEMVLDYSGRTSNGTWVGYDSANSGSYRSTGSAIDEGYLSGSEFKDPIIRSVHGDVQDKLTKLTKKGRLHDLKNNSSIYNSVPEWIRSDDQLSGKHLVKLTQIISSYFDTLALQIKFLPRLKNPVYPSSSYKAIPFADQLLENHGLLVPELFTDSTILEQFAQQNEIKEFDMDLREVKNLIYKNIYNNLSYIYKSKGTEKSFRNLIRCFGIDDEIIKINIYGDNSIYEITGNYRHTVTKKNYLDLNSANRNSSVVYQYLESSNTSSVSFITSSYDSFSGSARTFEAEVIFPERINPRVTNYEFTDLSSSLFGLHTAGTEENVLTWPTPVANADQDIRIYAVREKSGGKNVHFKLESTFLGTFEDGNTYLTSSLYDDVYNNEKWNFAIRFKRDIHPLATGVTSSGPNGDINPCNDTSGSIEFYGVNVVQDYVKNEFLVTSSIALDKFNDLVSSAKRIYAGAHRQDFGTTVLQKSDVKIGSVRFWLDDIPNDIIREHAYDVENYGTEHPYRNSFLFQGPDKLAGLDEPYSGSIYIPQAETLALHWNFATLTGSDDSGEFVVMDASSGSVSSRNGIQVRYGDNEGVGTPLARTLKRQHTGKGQYFPTNSSKVVDKVYVPNARLQPPEIIASSNMIEGRTRDDRLLTRNSRPITHFIGIEKSPYQSVTEEMLKIFATLTDFNNLIGEPVSTYRPNYKQMDKLKQMFFERIDNVPDVEKYIDYYKWIDNAVDVIIHQLMPMSANTSENLSTMIESHVLERNKFRHKYPFFNSAYANWEPESSTTSQFQNAPQNPAAHRYNGNSSEISLLEENAYESVTEATVLNNFALSPMNTRKGILWWQNRAERDKTDEISSGDATVDKQREIYRKIITSAVAFSGSSYKDASVAQVYRLRTGLQLDDESHKKHSNSYSRSVLKPFSSTSRLRTTASNVVASESTELYGFRADYDFESEPVPGLPSGKKRKLNFAVENVDDGKILKHNIAAPFSIYTSSAGRIITNIHNDSAATLQGPFTEKYVGGLQYRHIQINSGSELDTKYTRPQGFKLIVSDESDLNNNATATITITDYTELNSTDKVNLVATDGTNYNFTQGDQSSVNGTWEATTSNNQTATNLMNVINTSSGPAGTRFTATVNGAVVTVTQATGGTDGNTTVTLTDTGTAGMSKTDFTGGGEEAKLFRSPIIGTMLNYAPPDLDSNLTLDTELPRAMFYRDETAKRPINIRNIKSASYGIGNYRKNYEVILTSGRSSNSKYNVTITGAVSSSVVASDFPDLKEFALPERAKNESVIVNRFSAPGGPEVMSRGFLDTAAEEYSVYNALPYRNLAIRQPYQTLLKRYTSQFGEDSVFGAGSGSSHKVHRNTRYRLELSGDTVITGTVRDNGFVTRPIPQSDLQYAWITASAYQVSGGLVQNAQLPFGYEQPNIKLGGASNDIQFVSSAAGIINKTSDRDGIPVDFIGLNITYVDDVDSDNNLIFPLDGTGDNPVFGDQLIALDQIDMSADGTYATPDIAAVNIYRNGAYGWPSWKQIRNEQHRITRFQRKNNTYNFYENTQPKIINEVNNNDGITGFKDNSQLKQYRIPAITTKFKPLTTTMFDNIKTAFTFKEAVYIKASYTYSNLNSYLLIDEGLLDTKHAVIKQKPEINEIITNINNIKVKDIEYKEVIYPRAEFTSLAKTRGRLAYNEFFGTGSNGYDRINHRTFWRSRAEDRQRTNFIASNSLGTELSSYFYTADGGLSDQDGPYFSGDWVHQLHPMALSVWPLDSFPGGYMSGGFVGHKYDERRSNIGAAGELYTQVEGGLVSSSDAGTHPAAPGQCFFFYQHYGWFGVSDTQTWPSEYYISASGPGKNKPGFAADTDASAVHLHHFKPQYSASALSSLTPWYDSYEAYADNIRPLGKDYSIVPEFRVSEHMEYYLKKGFLTKNNKYLSLVGASKKSRSSGSSEVLFTAVDRGFTGINVDQNELQFSVEEHLSSSAASENEPSIDDFYKIYSHSDFLDSFNLIKSKNLDKNVSQITLKCKGIKKLLPYQGFYPVLRCVQLGSMLSQSFSPYLTASSDSALSKESQVQALIQPFFSPGIMYNTIKSGIAVDWPVITGSTKIGDTAASFGYLGYLTTGSSLVDKQYHNRRFPFESLVSPERYIPAAPVPGAEQGATGVEARVNMAISPAYRSGSQSDEENVYDFEGNAPHFIWTGEHDDKYNLAMHNFLGEIPKFFLEDERLTTFASKQGPFTMVSGTTYYMDVVLEKTSEFIQYEGPHIDMKETNSETGLLRYSSGSARGLHYGPACDVLGEKDQTTDGLTATHNANYNWLSNIQDPAFAPYTPPYFYGSSVARITFSPHKHRELLPSEGPQTFTIAEILDGARVETIYEPNRTASYAQSINSTKDSTDGTHLEGYIRVPEEKSLAGVSKMKIDSSINLFGKTKVKEVTYETGLGPNGKYAPVLIKDSSEETFDVWTISTKFECPTLNFSGNAKGHFTRGMWFGYGEEPPPDQGIFLRIRESFPEELNKTKTMKNLTANPLTTVGLLETGSLIQVCGFTENTTKTKRRIGRIANQKVISEAIIAIPFRAKSKESVRGFFDIPKDYVDLALDRASKKTVKKYQKKGIEVGESIIDMVEKMQKYVIPPQHDFVINKNVRPFAMYVFEFEHTFDKEDLSNIWQNLMPKIARNPELDEVEITHPCGVKGEFFEDGEIPFDIKWMIYKVKKRAEKSYFNVTADSTDDDRFEFEFNVDSEKKTPDYSYNWPYDFFSLVELAKVEANIKLSALTIEQQKKCEEKAKKDNKECEDYGYLDGGKNN